MEMIIFILLRAIQLYSYVLFAYVLLSWVPSLYDSAIGKMIISLVRPVITPFRRFNLQFFGLDWTIVVVWMVLNVISRILWQLLFIL